MTTDLLPDRPARVGVAGGRFGHGVAVVGLDVAYPGAIRPGHGVPGVGPDDPVISGPVAVVGSDDRRGRKEGCNKDRFHGHILHPGGATCIS